MLFCVLLLLQPTVVFTEEILITMDAEDGYVLSMIQHLNVSFMYYVDKINMEGFVLNKYIFTDTTSENTYCERLLNTTLVINMCRDQEHIEIVESTSQLSKIPTIQVDFNYWSLPLTFVRNETILPSNNTNYLVLIPPTSVFHDIISDIYPSLNIASELTIVYDNIYDASYTSWRTPFAQLPFPTQFVKMETSPKQMKQQVQKLQGTTKNIFLVAKTKNIEQFVLQASTLNEQSSFNWFSLTKDITAFKCDECVSVSMYWIRPFRSGLVQSVRNIDEFLALNEIGTEINYHINGWDEVDVSFYMDVMKIGFHWISRTNNTFGYLPTFSCLDLPSSNFTISLEDTVQEKNTNEYGPFIQVESDTWFENVDARIYKIDRTKDNEDAMYNKQLGSWKITSKLLLLYGSLDVDVRTLTHYRIVTIIQPPFVEKTNDPLIPYDGYCIDLINLIKDAVNFTYTIYEVEDGSFGTMDDNGNWNGLIGALVTGSADIALAPLSVMAERENDVDFTVPYYDLVGTTILMKKADVEYSLFKFMKVLEWPVWLCIVAAYLFTSVLLWIFDRFSPYSYTNNKERYKQDSEKRVFSLKECLWFCMTSLTPQGGGEAPKNISGRLVAATWWLFGFIIIASYTANLAAFLTVSRLEQPISSLDDLAKQYKIEYAPVQGSASETYFRRMAEIEEQFYNIWKEMSLNESMSPRDRAKLAVWDYPVSDKFTNMWRYMQESKLPPNMDVAIDRVLTADDGFAFIGDATEIKYAALTNCQLQQVGTEFSRKPYAIAVQTGHPLKDQISSAILMLLNQRRLETLKEKWWNDNPNKVTCPESTDESDGISIQNIGGVFIVILAGIILSVITLTFEYFYYRRNAPVILDPSTEKEAKVCSMSASSSASTLTKRDNGMTKPSSEVNLHTYENGAFQY